MSHFARLLLAASLLSLPAAAQSYDCVPPLGTNCTANIPDASRLTGNRSFEGTLLSTLTVLPGKCKTESPIRDLDVQLRLSHQAVGDLTATLIHPSGERATLLFHSGLSETSASCIGDDLTLTFDDEGVASIAACAQTVPALSGTARPFAVLSSFDGLARSGVWTLEVRDTEPGEFGALEGWSLVMPCELPAVSISPVEGQASEPTLTHASFTVSRAGAVDQPLEVRYSVEGTATPGSDYTALPGSIVIPAQSSTATIDLAPLEDTLVEETETVVLRLLPGEYSMGAPTLATATIADQACGDGVLSAGELCDDGNLTSFDGCDALCRSEPPLGCGCAAGAPPSALALTWLGAGLLAWLARRRGARK